MSVVTVLKGLWALHPPRFWMIWITTTTASLIYVVWVIGYGTAPSSPKTPRPATKGTSAHLQLRNAKAQITLVLLAVFVTSYTAMMVVWETFAYYDNDDFILYQLRGHNFSPPIWPQNGRFFPFGMVEFNLIRHLTNSPIGYQIVPILEVLILVSILLILDIKLSITARASLAILTLLTPGILLSFGGLIFEERNVMVLIAVLALSVQQFERTESVAWAVVAVLCAQIMLYFKEVSFLLLFGFSAGRLILRCRDWQNGRWHYKRLWDQDSLLDLCLASLAVLFLFTYVAVMGLHGNTTYASGARYRMAEVIRVYLRLDLLVWLFMAVVLRRIYLILRHRAAPSVLWDGLAFGGVAWVFGYLILGMCTGYYLAPADLIAVLYVGRIVFLSWEELPSWSKAAVLMLGLVVVLQDLSLSAFTVFERKNLIRAKAEIASVVKARSLSGNVPSLFFPFAKPYEVMGFIVYLNYRHVPIYNATLVNAATAKDGPCVDYRPNIKCQRASQPAPGDLVIVLPDDEASFAEAAVYRESGEPLFSYDPRPSFARWLYPFVSVPLATYDHNMRPNRWMDASVTLWDKSEIEHRDGFAIKAQVASSIPHR